MPTGGGNRSVISRFDIQEGTAIVVSIAFNEKPS
jgi:hypothetical protein